MHGHAVLSSAVRYDGFQMKPQTVVWPSVMSKLEAGETMMNPVTTNCSIRIQNRSCETSLDPKQCAVSALGPGCIFSKVMWASVHAASAEAFWHIWLNREWTRHLSDLISDLAFCSVR